MATIINARGNTEYVDDTFARALAFELLARCHATLDRAEQWGAQVSDRDAQRAQDDYAEARRLFGEIGEVADDTSSAVARGGDADEDATHDDVPLARKVAEVYQQLAPPMDSVTPAADSAGVAETSETGLVTVKAIPGSGGYYVVLGKGGPAQFATHTAAEAEARRRVGSRP